MKKCFKAILSFAVLLIPRPFRDTCYDVYRVGISIPIQLLSRTSFGRGVAWALIPRVRRASRAYKTQDCGITLLSYGEFLFAEQLAATHLEQTRQARYDAFACHPHFHIVIPVYAGLSARTLKRCIQSVQNQTIPHWSLQLLPSENTDAMIPESVAPFTQAPRDAQCTPNSPEGQNTQAEASYTFYLDPQGTLAKDALFYFTQKINESPDAQVLFSDFDHVCALGLRHSPFFHFGFSVATLRSAMTLGHGFIVHSKLAAKLGNPDPAFQEVQIYELALRLSELVPLFTHVPRVLYHRLGHPLPHALTPCVSHHTAARQQQAVQNHLDRLQIPATAQTHPQTFRTQLLPRKQTEGQNSDVSKDARPTVSILICSKDLGTVISRCLDSIYSLTKDVSFEVLVADNGSTDPIALEAFQHYPIRHLRMPEAFHYAAFNNRLAREARGEYLLFLNNDTEVLQPHWLSRMVLEATQPHVGTIGVQLLYPNRTVQHGGIFLAKGLAGHAFHSLKKNSHHDFGRVHFDRDVPGSTAACLLVAATTFHAVGGFDERFKHHLEDVDLNLKIQQAGYTNRYLGSITLIHYESISRGSFFDYDDQAILLHRWNDLFAVFSTRENPNLNPFRARINTYQVAGLLS